MTQESEGTNPFGVKKNLLKKSIGRNWRKLAQVCQAFPVLYPLDHLGADLID